jgi:hypothetical protein
LALILLQPELQYLFAMDLAFGSENGTVGSMPILQIPPRKRDLLGLRAGTSTTSTEKASKKEKKEKKETLVGSHEEFEVIIVLPDGRCCKVCSVKDSETDYVNVKIFIKWAKPPKYVEVKKAWINDGLICFYCGKLMSAQYKSIYKTIDGLLDAMSKETPEGQSLKAEVGEFTKLIKTECIKQKKYNIRIDLTMTQLAKSVTHRETIKVDVEEEDYIVCPKYYLSCNIGHWETNGLGHRYGQIGSNVGVIVPGAPIKKIKRVHIYPNSFRTGWVFWEGFCADAFLMVFQIRLLLMSLTKVKTRFSSNMPWAAGWLCELHVCPTLKFYIPYIVFRCCSCMESNSL